MQSLYPLRFEPILRRAVWGGRRLATLLGKSLPPGDDYAESWELCDRPADQSVVAAGPLEGTSLGDLVRQRGPDLLGRHDPQPRFPLLIKFLDAHQPLSVQVHPDDARAALLKPPDLGKTEAWVVLAAEPGSTIYAGLAPGVDRAALARAVTEAAVEPLLHRFQPRVGDCVFVPAGTVHALGRGLVIAEIQQSSDVTYRLFDWNRLGSDGRPRAMHVEAALAAIDYARGPVPPIAPKSIRSGVERLVACDKFILDRLRLSTDCVLGGDDVCRALLVVEGSVVVAGDPSGAATRGTTILLPAAIGETILTPAPTATLLCAQLP